MGHPFLKYLFLFLFSLIVFLSVGELAIRFIGSYDENGNFFVGKKTIRPYRIPDQTIKQNLREIMAVNGKARFQYDSLLGWLNVPGSMTGDSLYCYNKQGIRVAVKDANESFTRSTDTFRIVLIGDSFTHGDEINYEKSWPYLLEQKLNRAGLTTQVINLGVSGYGMDQAYLRWLEEGRSFHPDLVIFGLQVENIRRNVNLMRPVYLPNASLALSKPRFIIEADSLRLINVPPVPPEEVISTLEDFTNWELAQYEYFFHPTDYQPSFLLKSKFLGFLREAIWPDKSMALRKPYGTRSQVYPLEKEPAQVTIKILEALDQSVKDHDADCLILHLPNIWGLGHYKKYGELTYARFVKQLQEQFTFLDIKTAFESEFDGRIIEDFYLFFHYSELGNEIVAEGVTSYVLTEYLAE